MKRLKTFGSYTIILNLLIVLTFTNCGKSVQPDIEKRLSSQFRVLLQNTNAEYEMATQLGSKKFFPRSLTEEGKISFVASQDWCSGFFPGCLWLMAELTQDSGWQYSAAKYTRLLENEQWNGGTHDMGFKIMCSYGNGLKQIENSHYKEVIIQSAKTLISRYNPVVGSIRSWDHNADRWSFPVIIDNMMNLELLFKATELTGDSIYYQIAVAHAETTLRNHFREDNSSYHVVDYNPETGVINEKVTHQGDTDDSSWSRGQAWGLYGYIMSYRFTKKPEYLKQAENIAAYILNHPNLPSDKVPMWDFNYTELSKESRDVSAAAIIASALLELSQYTTNQQVDYIGTANTILTALEKNYALQNGAKNGYLLDHSVGFRHRNHEVDVPLIYADYYYLEALLRQRSLNKL